MTFPQDTPSWSPRPETGRPESTQAPRLLARAELVSGIARQAGAGAALLSSDAMIRWLGIDAPSAHVLISSGQVVILAASDASPSLPGEVERFDRRRPQTAVDALRRALQRAALSGTDPVAVEAHALPISLARALGERPCAGVDGELLALRARKDSDEIDVISRAADLATTGQRAVRAAVDTGVSELDLWTAANTAMQAQLGTRVHALIDLLGGPRTGSVDGEPTAHAIAGGEPVVFDLAPRLEGYWADSCATISCGRPSARLSRQHDIVLKALDRGLQFARPGVRAGALDEAMRTALEHFGLACPHHTGHGVGTAPQEPPWIVPGQDDVLAEGMVLALEPGAYVRDVGVRLEHVVVVEADGARPLTHHSLKLN